MNDYQAPLADMRFVLRELVDLGQLAELPGFGEVTADVADAVLDEAAKFAGTVLSPLNRSGDLEGVRWQDGEVLTAAGWKQAYGRFAADGWNALSCPAEFGGQNLPRVLSSLIEEMWNGANVAFALCPMLTRGAIDAIELRGSQAQRDLYLPKMVSGEWTGSMNLTEPQAGSDLSAVRTRAVPTGDGRYLLTGQKIFITYGEHDLTQNIVHMVLGRMAGAPEGVKGMSLFLVPKFLVNADGSLGARNDVHCLSVEHKLGIHASPTCVLAYGQNGGAVAELIGEENRGLEYMFIMMNAARYAVGIEGVGLAERAYQTALALCARASPGHRGRGARRRPRAHRAASRRAAHAAAHEVADRSHAGARRRGRGRIGRRPPASERGGAGTASGLRRSDDSGDQGLVHGEFGGHRLARHPSAWRRRIRRGNRRRANLAGCAHHADLRGHHRHPGQRFDRPQARARRRPRRADRHCRNESVGGAAGRRAEAGGVGGGVFRRHRCVGAGGSLRGGELRHRHSRRLGGRGAHAQAVRHRGGRLAAAAFGADLAAAAGRTPGQRRRCRLLRSEDPDVALLCGSCAVAGAGTRAQHRPRVAGALAEGVL